MVVYITAFVREATPRSVISVPVLAVALGTLAAAVVSGMRGQPVPTGEGG